MSTSAEDRVVEIVESLTSAPARRSEQVIAAPRPPSLWQRLIDPEASRHYQIQQTNRDITEETAELITQIGFVTKHAVAVKLQTLSGIEGLIAEHATSALARAYAPAIAAHAIEVMDHAIGATQENHVAYTSAAMRSRRR